MNSRSVVVLGIAAVALLAHASTASAAGKITSLTLNRPAIKTCAFETVTITGTGRCCSGYSVNFGDSHRIIALPEKNCPPFPFTFTHVYSKMGTYQVSVAAYTGRGSTCTGNVSRTVQVAAGPWITSTSFFSLGSQITPGVIMLLYGQNFGDMPGQVWIHLKDWQGNPRDYQLTYTDTHWSDTFVAGQIPDISGVINQQATLTVVAQCGAVSNAATVDFTPNIDVADLADHVDRLECSISTGASVSDQCLGWGGDQWPEECGWGDWGLGQGNNGFEGYHASGWGFHGNGGNDRYWVTTPLQNGWVLDSASATWQTKVGDVSTASEDPNTTSAPGTPSPGLGVDWYVGNCGMVLYDGHMIITGPKGVPF